MPLVDTQQQVKAIFSFSQEVTAHTDLVNLYHLYKKHYPAQQAIRQFLNYLHIRTYFLALPTSQELLSLLWLVQHPQVKYVAYQLRLSHRTVEEYKARLRNKLRAPCSLERLLVKLRLPFWTLHRSPSLDRIAPSFTGEHLHLLNPGS